MTATLIERPLARPGAFDVAAGDLAPDGEGRLRRENRPPDPFREPGLFVTYGLARGLWTPAELVTKAKTAGYRWLAVEAENTSEADRAAFTVACRNALLVPGIWQSQVEPGSPTVEAAGFDFYIGQVEGPGQYDRLVQSLPPDCARAVITNFGGLDTPELAFPLVANGYHCIAESWVKTNPAGTPAAQVDYARRVLGFPTCSPMAGLGENGANLADYPGLETFPGWSVFPAEALFS